MNAKLSSRMACVVAALAALLTTQTWATGPEQQKVSNRAPGHTLNSVVEVNGVSPGCTGSVISKTVDGNNNGWFSVLTADHCVRGVVGHTIAFGDPTGGAGPGLVYGGLDSWYATRSPVGGVKAEDVAVLAIRYGTPDQFFNDITPFTRVNHPAYDSSNPVAPPPNQFTEIGYGLTGLFANGGMNGIASDGHKRFQNNKIERWNHRVSARYDYWGIQWDFDAPTAAGFLAAEGLSYAGDSGGPYLSYSGPLDDENIPMFDRSEPGWNPEVPKWNGGNMQLATDWIFAVHTFGQSVPNGFSPFTTPTAAGTRSGGVPLTEELNGWITARTNELPEPATCTFIILAGLWAIRRPRPSAVRTVC